MAKTSIKWEEIQAQIIALTPLKPGDNIVTKLFRQTIKINSQKFFVLLVVKFNKN